MNTERFQASAKVQSLPERLTFGVKILFTDVDDTLTWEGQLPLETFSALHKLREANIAVVPVTGACAGWCDCLIKTWPINSIIGENGALYMGKDSADIVHTYYLKDETTISDDLAQLKKVANELSSRFPLIGFTQDQPFRLTDIAFDIGQTVSVPDEVAKQATGWLIEQGLQARQSSIHINAWLGDHSKSTAAMEWIDRNNIDIADCLFIGDSPNDESMFQQFTNSVGVANVERFLPQMKYLPAFITKSSGGYGFAELAEVLIS